MSCKKKPVLIEDLLPMSMSVPDPNLYQDLHPKRTQNQAKRAFYSVLKPHSFVNCRRSHRCVGAMSGRGRSYHGSGGGSGVAGNRTMRPAMAKARAIFEGRGRWIGGGFAGGAWTGIAGPAVQETVTVLVVV
jgi:hypothetical protein